MYQPAVSDREFKLYQSFLYENAGIHITPHKKSLLITRLGKRLRHYGLSSLGEYYEMIKSDQHHHEMQTMIDLLTTNETYFFREQKHFDYLSSHIKKMPRKKEAFRVWSAASSTGEEAYSIAITLADSLGVNGNWEVLGTDINKSVLEHCKRAVYKNERTELFPKEYMCRYCLNGVRSRAGSFLIDQQVRKHTQFKQMNLNDCVWEDNGKFDFIFLRNVMIYFDADVRRRLVDHIAESLKPGGHLFIGHSETLSRISDRFHSIRPAIYKRKD